ncbi:MAG: ATP-binding protein [Xanthomonadaceae bacterium]|nr:ATP-binding protein [Xanthomonadaceae bacterium]
MKLPQESFFIFGARGTGKTSLIETHLKTDLSIELLSQENYFKYSADPGLFRRQIENLNSGSWVWIDEIQRLPELLNEVHWGIEKKKLKFALSGSSARKLRRAGTNLLAGRALSKLLFPFIPKELGQDFDLEHTLEFGSIPLIQQSQDKKQKLRAYVHSYLKEEVQSEALVKDLPSFVRFLKVASLLHAQELSLSSIARDVGVKRPTVENYFSILEDTHLAFSLQPLDSGIRVKERMHPKFYWIDPGVVRALREEWGPIHALERGPLFEGLVLMILRAYQSYSNAFDEISYWATPQVEVDFVVKNNSFFTAIEVKSGSRFRTEDCDGLRAISDLKKLKRRIIVYPAIDKQKTSDGIEIMSFLDFCDQLDSGNFF